MNPVFIPQDSLGTPRFHVFSIDYSCLKVTLVPRDWSQNGKDTVDETEVPSPMSLSPKETQSIDKSFFYVKYLLLTECLCKTLNQSIQYVTTIKI